MIDMTDAVGLPIAVLSNTVVVENLVGSGSYPTKVNCLNDESFIDGTISAIGTNVTSLLQSGCGYR